MISAGLMSSDLSAAAAAGFLIALGVAEPEDASFLPGLGAGALVVVRAVADPGLALGALLAVAGREDNGVLGEAVVEAVVGLDERGTLGLVGADLGAAGLGAVAELVLVADVARGVVEGRVRGRADNGTRGVAGLLGVARAVVGFASGLLVIGVLDAVGVGRVLAGVGVLAAAGLGVLGVVLAGVGLVVAGVVLVVDVGVLDAVAVVVRGVVRVAAAVVVVVRAEIGFRVVAAVAGLAGTGRVAVLLTAGTAGLLLDGATVRRAVGVGAFAAGLGLAGVRAAGALDGVGLAVAVDVGFFLGSISLAPGVARGVSFDFGVALLESAFLTSFFGSGSGFFSSRASLTIAVMAVALIAVAATAAAPTATSSAPTSGSDWPCSGSFEAVTSSVIILSERISNELLGSTLSLLTSMTDRSEAGSSSFKTKLELE